MHKNIIMQFIFEKRLTNSIPSAMLHQNKW